MHLSRGPGNPSHHLPPLSGGWRAQAVVQERLFIQISRGSRKAEWDRKREGRRCSSYFLDQLQPGWGMGRCHTRSPR